MNIAHQPTDFNRILSSLMLSAILVFTLFALQSNQELNLWDEGYLWYGAQRVASGEIPKLDFKAYDLGRYYWSAWLMQAQGATGIIELRAAISIFQLFGLFVGILLIVRTLKKNDYFFCLLAALILVTWMLPRHKLFDISLSIFLIGIISFLIQNPSNWRFFFSGVGIGLVAVFGRNHGLYGVVAFIGTCLYLKFFRHYYLNSFKSCVSFSSGILIGYLPILLMLILVPGFAPEFWDGLKHQVGKGSTNLFIPIPWPWTIELSRLSTEEFIRELIISLCFVGVLTFGILGPIWLIIKGKKEPQIPSALIACIFLALPYSHYAFSRADIAHLAQGIFPTLIGVIILSSRLAIPTRWLVASLICIISIWTLHIHHAGWACYKDKNCKEISVSDSQLQVSRNTEADIAFLRDLKNKYAPAEQSFVVTPFWPGAYALFNRKSPMWDIYALFPRSEKFQSIELARLKKADPQFILILDFKLRGSTDRQFKYTNPLIYSYITENFMAVNADKESPYKTFISKERQ